MRRSRTPHLTFSLSGIPGALRWNGVFWAVPRSAAYPSPALQRPLRFPVAESRAVPMPPAYSEAAPPHLFPSRAEPLPLRHPGGLPPDRNILRGRQSAPWDPVLPPRRNLCQNLSGLSKSPPDHLLSECCPDPFPLPQRRLRIQIPVSGSGAQPLWAFCASLSLFCLLRPDQRKKPDCRPVPPLLHHPETDRQRFC